MNLKHVMIVLKKELKDSFRDKKSVLTNILLPLILIPLMYYFMNMGIKSMTSQAEEDLTIGVISNDINTANEFVKQNIIGEDNINIVNVTQSEVNQKLENGDISCALVFSDNFFEKLNNDENVEVELKYNSLKNSSSLGMQRLNSKIMALNQILATSKLQSMNISPDILNLITPTTNDISKELNDGKTSNDMLTMIIPMYLVIVIVTAGIPLAVDIIAGERERNTFEALFSTKADRLSILVGKYLSILIFSVIAVIMSFIGLILGIVLNPEMFSTAGADMSLTTMLQALNMPIGAMLLILLASITLAAAFAGIQIAISTMAKTVKEAQTYLSYLTFPAMILGFSTMFMGAMDINRYMSFIPVFNTIAAIKMVLSGIIDYYFLTITVVVNVLFIIVVLIFIVNLFKKEKTIIK